MELLKTKYPVVLLSGFNNYDKIIEQTKFAGLKKLMEEQTPAFSLGYTDALGTIDHNAAQACVIERTSGRFLRPSALHPTASAPEDTSTTSFP